MARPKAKAPALRCHISGQSVVTIDGRDFYLGRHDSPESLARYAVLISIYQANHLSLPESLTLEKLDERAAMLRGVAYQPTDQSNEPILVRHVTAAYREHGSAKYASDPIEIYRLNQICDALDKHAGDVTAEAYGPLALQRQRQRWIDEGKSRGYCNRLTRVVIRIFRYAVSQELVDVRVCERLRSVEPLRKGQTTAHESQKVSPVSLDVVRATAQHLSPVLKAMLRVHVATGMRPSELCVVRPCDIDRSGPVWIYRPKEHKTASHGKSRSVPIIGDAREALTDYLNRDPSSFCFSPIESVAWWLAQKRSQRKSKVQPSQVDRSLENPKKGPGDRFTAGSYRQAIQRAAKRAEVQSWHPYQLRHLAGTVVRDALGAEAAQALLGHSHVQMTEHYAKLTEQAAIKAAEAAPKL